jgi:PiT family inorganic phosphate transporter
VSTTHCITACILGVGSSRRLSAVRWGVAGNLLAAWVLTIPLSAASAYASLLALRGAPDDVG